MTKMLPGRQDPLRASVWTAIALLCAGASAAWGQGFRPVGPTGGAPPWPDAVETPDPPAAARPRSVLAPASSGDPFGVYPASGAAPIEQPLQVAEKQEEIPPPGGAPPPLPTAEDEIPLFDLDGCVECRSCVPGQFHQCPPVLAGSHVGRFLHAAYHNICCTDPCYDPQWWALADAAFYTPGARPVTQQRFRWDAGYDMVYPDRAEFFWARSGGGGAGPSTIVPSLRFHQLSMYTEVAHGSFGAFFVMPYRSVYTTLGGHEAGFSDLNFGTKAMLHDTELMQLTFQFRTYTPVGVASRGLGTGHVSLEPSLLLGLNLSPFSYFQGQVAEWIPLGGDPDYAGALLHYHFAYNHSLAGSPEGVHLIGTAELNGWSFQDGAYSAYPSTQLLPASNHTYLSGGPGLRVVICDAIDFGVGAAFSFTRDQWADQLYRSELRLRF